MKKILLLGALLLFGVLSYGLYHYLRPPENLKNKEADIVLTAAELKEQLTTDSSAKIRLSNKIILVEGTVSSVEQGEHLMITLDSSVRGELEKNTAVPEPGKVVSLKGMLGGYEEIFDEVVLIKCELEELI
jgi:starvation-inducible outer membrane lipoprotein